MLAAECAATVTATLAAIVRGPPPGVCVHGWERAESAQKRCALEPACQLRRACRLLTSDLVDDCTLEYTEAKLGQMKQGLRLRWQHDGRHDRTDHAYVKRTLMRLDTAWTLVKEAVRRGGGRRS